MPGRDDTPRITMRMPSVLDTLDSRFWIIALVVGSASLLAYGLLAAIIPNPIFGRIIPADAASIAVWLASAPLMGMLAATYISGVPGPSRGDARASRLQPESGGSGRVTFGAMATFFAIGCPVCNKIILLALGTSGALNLFAPIQPLIGAGSLALLGGTLVWRLRRRAEGCRVPAATVQS